MASAAAAALPATRRDFRRRTNGLTLSGLTLLSVSEPPLPSSSQPSQPSQQSKLAVKRRPDSSRLVPPVGIITALEMGNIVHQSTRLLQDDGWGAFGTPNHRYGQSTAQKRTPFQQAVSTDTAHEHGTRCSCRGTLIAAWLNGEFYDTSNWLVPISLVLLLLVWKRDTLCLPCSTLP